MTQLLARIMLALLMLPLALLVFTLALALLAVTGLGEMIDMLAAGVMTACFVGVYWVCLWRRTVRWTASRMIQTYAMSAVATCIGIGVGIPMSWVDKSLGIFIFTTTTTLLWLVGTVFVWRETADERAARIGSGGSGSRVIACPRCGYNLTGLQSTQCPECGMSFTLDELLAARRPDVDITG